MTVNPQILVSMVDNVVVVKLTGRANFTSSVNFKTLVNELVQRGHRRFVLELSDCLIMDSTFLGVLAGLGLKLEKEFKGKGQICLLKPNPRILDLLENLGV